MSTYCQGLCCTFSEIFTIFDATLAVGSIVKSHQSRYMTPYNRV
jgi:hypothetical protein